MDRNAQDFRALIHHLAVKHHRGRFYPMAAKIGVSAGTVDQWKRGIIKTPKIDTLHKLCEAYNLRLPDVLRLFKGAAAVLLVLAFTLYPWGSAQSRGVLYDRITGDVAHYVKYARRRLWGFPTWPPCLA